MFKKGIISKTEFAHLKKMKKIMATMPMFSWNRLAFTSVFSLCFVSVHLIKPSLLLLELFYLNSTLNFGIPTVLVFQLEVYYKVDRLLTGLTAQQKGTTARWYSNKSSLRHFEIFNRKWSPYKGCCLKQTVISVIWEAINKNI